MAHARVQALERVRELLPAEVDRRLLVGAVALRVLDQVAVERLAVADGRLEAHGILDEIEQLLDALLGEAALLGELLRRRVAVQLLRELPARAHHAAHLLGDVDGKADRPALVGERARDRLADPPRRVGRKLEAHPVVELLDRADQAEVALLDQIEQRHARPRVMPCDRHHEAEVRLDQLPLRFLVAGVLAPGELALFLAREQRPVADLADVEPQRIAGRRLRDRSGLLGVVGRVVVRRDDLERSVLRRFRKHVRDFHDPAIGRRPAGLEHSRYPAGGMQEPPRSFRIRLRTSTSVSRQRS